MNELQPQNNREYPDACLDRGLLVGLRDGELAAVERERALAHLAVCPDCRADERSMQTDSQEVYVLLTALGPSPEELPDTEAAFAALQLRLSDERGRESSSVTSLATMGSTLRALPIKKSRPRRWWIAAAAAVLAAVLVIPNAPALAHQFLGLFQPQTFQPVSVNLQSFRSGIGEDLQNFGQLNVTPSDFGGIPNPTQAQVQQQLNFKLLLPGQLPSGVGQAKMFLLIDSSKGTFTFNAAQARAYLDSTGQGNVSIPPELDGATFTLSVAPGVIVSYGKQCQTEDQNATGSIWGVIVPGCSGGKPFYLAEVPSPVLRATGNASLEDLRSFILSLPKLSRSVRLLLQDVNLSTGVVPLPIPAQVQAEKVSTHGVQGVLMVDSSLSLGAVLWQKDGIIYLVAGETSDKTEIKASANSLQ
jgi:Putative zinc-finger